MRVNLYFGDYYNDGHGHYITQPIEVPKFENIKKAEDKIKEKYPEFFDTFCTDYEDNHIGTDVERALLDTSYPIERFIEYGDDAALEQFHSLYELFTSEFWEFTAEHCIYDVRLVVDAVIWVLNAFGAEITIIPKEEVVGYDFSCGYGMFY